MENMRAFFYTYLPSRRFESYHLSIDISWAQDQKFVTENIKLFRSHFKLQTDIINVKNVH